MERVKQTQNRLTKTSNLTCSLSMVAIIAAKDDAAVLVLANPGFVWVERRYPLDLRLTRKQKNGIAHELERDERRRRHHGDHRTNSELLMYGRMSGREKEVATYGKLFCLGEVA